MNKALKYGALLIVTYLIVVNGTNSGKVLASGAAGTRDVVKAFQGR